MRTEMMLERLKVELQMNCGDMLAAAKMCGVSLMFVNQWRKDDKVVDDALKEAEQVGTQGLVSAAIERAVKGIDEDVYYKGIVVGQKKAYSDGLLTTLLKAKVPEFHKDSEGGVSVNVNIANVMPRANSYEDWLQMKAQTTKQLETPAKQLEVVDAEYEVVENPFKGLNL